jgi:hypothetical protein
MSRSALTLLAAAASSLVLSSTVYAQAKPATPAPAAPTQTAPATKARWVPPVRGTATIGMVKPVTKVVAGEVVTKIKLKNMSQGAIALLRVDEYWYDRQGNMLPGDTKRIKKPILPGEVIEVELKVPKNEKFYQNQYKFSHANGDIKVESLKKIE